MVNILIVDDKSDIRDLVADILSDEGYHPVQAHSVETVLASIEEVRPDLVILDIWLDGHHMDGIGLLKMIRKNYSNVLVIMISGHANPEIAALAIKLGAYDFIEKPFKSEKLLFVVKRALEARLLNDAHIFLQRDLLDAELIGASKYTIAIKEEVKNLANTNSRIMLQGETGTGKSTLARMIHLLSPRCTRKFIHVKSYNKKSDELDAYLFGNDNKPTALEQADGGTLFLDEVTNIPLYIQQKLLDVMQTGILNKKQRQLSLDIRFIGATAKNINEALTANLLNKSFYSRLNVTNFLIPPLRERKSDIIPLSQHFIKQFSHDFMTYSCNVDQSTYSLMLSYEWPGNIRQLKNTIEYLLIIAAQYGTSVIASKMLPGEILHSTNLSHKNLEVLPNFLDKEYKQAKQIFEKRYLSAQLTKFDGNIARTAQFIGMDRTALHRKIKFLKIFDT
ncbi:putative response regulator NtrX-like [Alphaproteobacteria bacterium]